MAGQHLHEQKSDGHETHQVEVIAHFPSSRQAQNGATAVSEQGSQVQIKTVVAAQLQQEVENAQSGISVVEIGMTAWVGLFIGGLLGAVLGWFLYNGQLAIPGMAQILSAGLVATTFLGAGVLGAFGWFIGAAAPLLQTPGTAPAHEVRLQVAENELPRIEEKLVNAGAMEVLAMGNGSAVTERNGHHTGHDR